MSERLDQRDVLATQPADGDLFHVVDVSDATDHANGTSKKIAYSVLAPDSSDTVKGKVELATTAETTTGTDATRAVTPDGLHDMTSLAGAAWFLDDDTMSSDSATKVPSQQSVKSYVDTHASDTTTHGTTGNIVGTSDSQTLTNKTLTNPVINYTDTTIGVNVKARAARTTNQSIADATATKLTLDTETYDVGGDFDAATNYRFTAPVTGYYMICAQVNYASAADGSVEQLDIRKNGSDLVRATGRASGTGNASVNLSDIVLLTATDYIELWFTHGTGAGENCTGFMSVHLLSV